MINRLDQDAKLFQPNIDDKSSPLGSLFLETIIFSLSLFRAIISSFATKKTETRPVVKTRHAFPADVDIHRSFVSFVEKRRGQSIARAWNFEIGDFIRECSRMWEENDCYVLPSPSTENSASLPIGITSWKIDKTHVHEARESKARKGGCSSSASRRNPKRQEITRSSRPSSRREPSSLERLWNNAKSLSTLICQTIASVSSFPSLPPSCGISRQGIDSHSLPDSFPFFFFFFFFIPRIIDRFFRIYLPYKYNVVEELIDEIIGTRKVFLFCKIDAFKIGRKHYRTRFRLNKDCINLPQFRHLHRNQKNIYIYFA